MTESYCTVTNRWQFHVRKGGNGITQAHLRAAMLKEIIVLLKKNTFDHRDVYKYPQGT